MQRLKKILILMFMLIAFSLICIGIAKANTTITAQSFPVIEAYMQETGGTIEDFRDIVMQNITKPDDFDDYEHYVVLLERSGRTNSFQVEFILSDTFNFALSGTNLYLCDGPNQTRHSIRYFTINSGYVFNNDYTELTLNGSWVNFPNYQQIVLYNPLNYIIISSDLEEINYERPTWSTDTLSINNLLYPFGSYIPLSDLNYYNLNVIDYYDIPLPDKCNPSDFLGKFSNVSSFDVTIKSKTNALKGVVDGAFDIISSSYMTENDWNITYTSNDDDIIHSGTLSCITNRCVFRYQAGVEDDIDTDIILNYHFEPVSGVAMPTTIQIDTCYDSDFYINTTYKYVNDDSSGSGNVVIPSTDNFLQDGTLPNVSGLADSDIIPDGPVDSILLLPLNVMQSLLNVLNSSTCSPVIIPIPFSNNNLSLPCISTIYATIGSIQPMFTSFLNWFSAIVSAFILYQYFIFLYKWVDDTLTFRENNHFGGY